MAQVSGRPFLETLFRQLERNGFRRSDPGSGARRGRHPSHFGDSLAGWMWSTPMSCRRWGLAGRAKCGRAHWIELVPGNERRQLYGCRPAEVRDRSRRIEALTYQWWWFRWTNAGTWDRFCSTRTGTWCNSRKRNIPVGAPPECGHLHAVRLMLHGIPAEPAGITGAGAVSPVDSRRPPHQSFCSFRKVRGHRHAGTLSNGARDSGGSRGCGQPAGNEEYRA